MERKYIGIIGIVLILIISSFVLYNAFFVPNEVEMEITGFDSDIIMSYTIPAGWHEVKYENQTRTGGSYYAPIIGDPGTLVYINIAYETNTTLDEMENRVNNNTLKDENIEIISQKNRTVNGLKAYEIIYNLHAINNKTQKKEKVMAVYIEVKNKNGLPTICLFQGYASPEQFDSQLETFKSIVNSIKVPE